MVLNFYKFEGTGNDFIVLDDRGKQFCFQDSRFIASLCERKMGIGADGLILLRDHVDYDFEMVYFNSNGYESTMCGNGGRCIISFANILGLIDTETTFKAIDGVHQGKFSKDRISLQMKSVDSIKEDPNGLILDTGSPHCVVLVDSLADFDVEKEGRKIRNSRLYGDDGINVNFVAFNADTLFVRTYERGVELETLSCGTGVVASAIAMHYNDFTSSKSINISTKGGMLSVVFDVVNGVYENIWLIGPATMVYAGEFEC